MAAIANGFDSAQIFASTIGGLVLAAPKGTAAPASVVADWPTGWKSVGLISDDGVTTTMDTDVEDKNAWNAKGTVKRIPKSAGLSFQFTCMQSNALTHELYFGSIPTINNTTETRTAIPATSPVKEWSFAVEYPGLDGTTKERWIMPLGTVTDRGDIQQSETDLKQFEITVAALVYPGTTELGYVLSNSTLIVGV
jgi:hypothetical protein